MADFPAGKPGVISSPNDIQARIMLLGQFRLVLDRRGLGRVGLGVGLLGLGRRIRRRRDRIGRPIIGRSAVSGISDRHEPPLSTNWDEIHPMIDSSTRLDSNCRFSILFGDPIMSWREILPEKRHWPRNRLFFWHCTPYAFADCPLRRAVSSVGQSASLTRRRSQVRALYGPVK